MPFRTGASGKTLQGTLDEIQKLASTSKRMGVTMRADTLADILAWRTIIDTHSVFNDALEKMVVLAATPGLPQYAKDQYFDETYDVVGDYVIMRDALEGVRDWIETNIPDDAGDGFVANKYEYTIYTAAQHGAILADLLSELDAFIASVD